MLQNACSPHHSSTQEVPSKQVALVPSLSDFAKTIRDENAAIHAAVAAAVRDVLPHVLSLGRAARAAKRQLRKRQFGNWVRRECKVSWRHVQRCMAVTEAYEINATRVSHDELSHLSFRGRASLLTPPKPRQRKPGEPRQPASSRMTNCAASLSR